MSILHFSHCRVRSTVRSNDTVAKEVTIAWSVYTEVATISPIFTAVFILLEQTLVNPVPDVTTLEVRILVDSSPLCSQVTVGITHGVRIFRRNDWTVATLAAYAFQPLSIRILRHIHICVPFPKSTFVVHRTVHTHRACFLFLQVKVCLIEVVTITRFVTEWPDSDRRMVLVAFVHVDGTIHVWLQPFRVVTKWATLAEVIVHTVAFDVGFIVYIDTEFVAQVIELVALWIVAKANGVDVMLLHQFEVLAHQLFSHVVTCFRVMFVNVHTLELDRLTIDEEADVWLAIFWLFFDFLDFETTETYLVWDNFRYFIAFLQSDEQLVEVRMFRSPSLDILNFSFEVNVVAINALVALGYDLTLCIHQFVRCCSSLWFSYIDSKAEDTVLISVVQSRLYLEVLDVSLRLWEKEYIAFDTANAPEVLTFEVSTCTPTENLQNERVLTCLQILVQLEFGCTLRVFAIAYFFTIYIYIYTTLGTIDAQENVASVPVGRDFEVALVYAYRSCFRQLWRLRVTRLPFITMVGVDGNAMTLHFPVAWNLDICPSDVGSRLFDASRQILICIYIVEVPSAVKQLVIRTLGFVHRQCLVAVFVRHKGGSCRFSVHTYRLDVFPIRKSLLGPCSCSYATQGDASQGFSK